MTKENKVYIKVIHDKSRLYLLAQRLKNCAIELERLSEDEKRIIIERADQKNGLVLKRLYDSLNDYIGWE